jgi:hypothetical protein
MPADFIELQVSELRFQTMSIALIVFARRLLHCSEVRQCMLRPERIESQCRPLRLFLCTGVSTKGNFCAKRLGCCRAMKIDQETRDLRTEN